MRKILFRAKATTGEWVYGNYIFHTSHNTRLNEHQIHESISGITHDVIIETLGQFTGLLDRNGKEIFENDIVKVSDIDSGIEGKVFKPFNLYVKYENRIVGFNLQDYIYELHYAEFEVIGNIHDNTNC